MSSILQRTTTKRWRWRWNGPWNTAMASSIYLQPRITRSSIPRTFTNSSTHIPHVSCTLDVWKHLLVHRKSTKRSWWRHRRRQVVVSRRAMNLIALHTPDPSMTSPYCTILHHSLKILSPKIYDSYKKCKSKINDFCKIYDFCKFFIKFPVLWRTLSELCRRHCIVFTGRCRRVGPVLRRVAVWDNSVRLHR